MGLNAIKKELDALVAEKDSRIATLTAEVLHYTAGTPHPLVARIEALRRKMGRIEHLNEWAGGNLTFEEMANASMRTARAALQADGGVGT